MSDVVSSEGPKTTGIWPLALSIMHRDFSSFSKSFDDVMHCILGFAETNRLVDFSALP